MKKTLFSIMALILLFTAASVYACGNNDKADLNSGKADATVGNSETGSADVAIHHADVVVSDKNNQDAKAPTTEAHNYPSGSGASCTATCNSKKATGVKESAMKTDDAKDSKAAEKPVSTLMISAPVDLSAANQK